MKSRPRSLKMVAVIGSVMSADSLRGNKLETFNWHLLTAVDVGVDLTAVGERTFVCVV